MTEPLLELVGVRRDFASRSGVRRAVRGVDLTVGREEVVAVLGPNGAGKTTTVKMASTLLVPTEGRVLVSGRDAVARPREARRHLGLVLGGDRGFYARATARENLTFFAALQGVPRRRRRARVDEVLGSTGLSAVVDQRVETFSRGMRQRLHLARAVLAEPALLLLDEPSLGLDPQGARDLHDLVVGLRREGRGILLTSHQLTEVERLADRIVVIVDGVVAYTGPSEGLAPVVGIATVLSLVVAGGSDPSDTLRPSSGVVEVLADERRGAWVVDLLLSDADTVATVLAEVPPGLTILSSVTRAPTLEESYLACVARPGEHPASPRRGGRA